MSFFRRRQKNVRRRYNARLYAVVFGGRVSVMAVFLLFVSFLIQPFHQAIAAEPLPEEAPPPVAEDVRVQEVPEESAPETEAAPATEIVSEDDTALSPETEPETAPDTGDATASSSPDAVTDVPADNPDAVDEPPSDDTDANDNAAEEETDERVDKDEEVTESSDDEPTVGQVVEVRSLVTEDNFYQFSKQSCVMVGDGAYHCTSKEGSDIDTQSVVYADRGEDGSMEIFLRTSKGNIKQITENNVDDTAPHYDPESMRIVWQRLIDGRQQIVLFDIMEDKEAQLTFSKTNNMEPKVSDNGIVWQAWDNNDWEIMFFDGTYTEQLTDNDVQDVAPVIQDGYVLWNVLGGEEQQARVYSIDTRETASINGHEGGSIVNPRFVLVYDTQYENGDVVTQSFDPATGLSQPIAAKPAPEPIDIPLADPTGEIRALINNKSQKDEYDSSDPTATSTNNGTSTSTTSDTLDLKGPDSTSSTTTTIDTTVPEFTPIELTEYDLVIPPTAFADALQNAEGAQE